MQNPDIQSVVPLTACVKVTPMNPGTKLLRAPAPEIRTGAWGPLQLMLAICTEMSDRAPVTQQAALIVLQGWWNNLEHFTGCKTASYMHALKRALRLAVAPQ